MNPQLPPLPPPSEPLDEQERALARALRGLPSSMPPPELDARILGASRRAIAITAKPQTHRRGWVLGISTAAAAVLAVGVLLKMHLQGHDATIAAPQEVPAAQPVAAKSATTPAAAAASATDAAADSGTRQAEPSAANAIATNTPPPSAEVLKSERDETKVAKPAATPPAAIGTVAPLGAFSSTAGQSATPQAAAKAAPQPIPSSPVITAPALDKTSVTDQPSYLSSPAPPPPAPVSAANIAARPTLVPPPAEPAQMQERQEGGAARKDAAADHVEVNGSRGKRAIESAPLPAVDEDTKLTSSQWIGRIRDRVAAGDRAGARESLRQYIARYPDAWIPPELAPLGK